jgi:alanine dehydrogenase
MIFTFFHLAGVTPALTDALLASKTTAIAYETLEDKQGRLPILAPMSAVAGNMATLMGSYYLAKFNQGKGMQLGTVLGKKYGKALIIGNGVVGQHAAHVASSMGANVYIAAINQEKMHYIKESFLPEVNFFVSNQDNLEQQIFDADLIIGAVLRRGEKAPYVLTEEMVKQLSAGTVIVDVSIDQGGCIETSRPTSHSDPVFIKYDIVHYCVTNMPGAYPRTSTMALAEATRPYLMELANEGMNCFRNDAEMAKAVNTHAGFITYKPVAEDLGLMQYYSELKNLL